MLKDTAHRRVTARILSSTKDHPSADEIYRRALEQLPYITKPTVYNTLKKLEERGVIQSLRISDRELRYDWNTEFHPHLMCTSCGRVVDLEASNLQKILNDYLKDYTVEKIELNVFGLCSQCKTMEEGGEDIENRP